MSGLRAVKYEAVSGGGVGTPQERRPQRDADVWARAVKYEAVSGGLGTPKYEAVSGGLGTKYEAVSGGLGTPRKRRAQPVAGRCWADR